MNTTILALDLGTHRVGSAAPGRHHHQRHGALLPQRFEGGGMRFLRFKRWLNELLSASNHINAVFFEEVRRHAGVDAAHAYGGFMATSRRGVSTTTSRTRAFRWARSRSTRPARATRARTNDRVRPPTRSPRSTTTKPMPWPPALGSRDAGGVT